MTALGKILAFLNLIFALVMGALVVIVFATRTNWKAGYDDAVKQATALKSSNDVMNKQMVEERERYAERIKEVEVQRDSAIRDLNEKKAEIANLNTRVTEQSKIATTEGSNSQAATNEIQKLKNERDQMKAQITDRDQLLVKQEKDMVDLRNRAVSAEIARNATQQSLDKLMISYERLTAQLDDLRRRGIEPTTVAGGPSRSAPVEVRGRVLKVSDDLATISLGSDHGVQRGNLLQVYRMAPAPTWVGTLQIITTDTHHAVGKFTPNGRNVIRPDDTVDTKILLK